MELTELLEHRAHVMTRKEGANIDWVRWPIAEASRAQLQNIADNFLADTALLDFSWDQCQGCVQYQVEHGVQRGFVKLSISKLAEHGPQEELVCIKIMRRQSLPRATMNRGQSCSSR